MPIHIYFSLVKFKGKFTEITIISLSIDVLSPKFFILGNVPYPEYKSTEIPKLIQNGYRMGKIPHCSKEL